MSTTLAQLKLQSGGMSYVIHLPEGKFVLIDGGTDFERDGATLHTYLTKRAKDAPPVIAAWLFTHGHSDHIGLAARFMEKYGEVIKIEQILYNIPREGMCFNGYDAAYNDAAYEDAWFRAAHSLRDTVCHEVRTGEVFSFPGLTVKVLTTAYDRYPDPPTNRNETSAVYRLTFENGTRFAVLGDACGDRLAKLIDPASPIYCPPEELESEILQVTHHGLAVSGAALYEAVRELYRQISPQICFWPTPAERFYNDPWCRGEQYIYNQFLLKHAGVRNFHHTQTVEVDMETLHIAIL